MDSLIELISILTLIISIIVLIVFFQLASNVSMIRRYLLQQGEPPANVYHKHRAFGNKDEALKALQDIVWRKYKEIVAGKKSGQSDQRTIQLLEELRERYESRLIELGGKYPDLE